MPGGVANPEYAVLLSARTAENEEWLGVAEKLAKIHGGRILVLPGRLTDCADTLRAAAPRYLAIVGPADEFDREAVNAFHRATRQIDDDPYGDCIWGIITGRSAADAKRLAEKADPLIVRRAGGTTNLDPARFQLSNCITDWGPYHVRRQEGYTAPEDIRFEPRARMGDQEAAALVRDGIVRYFTRMMEDDRLQLVVTSSHATPYNLEMPFEKGLIISSKGRYHVLTLAEKGEYVAALRREEKEGEGPILDLVERKQYPVIRPDGQTRIWLAAGNCLFGDAHRSGNSMALTALSSYGCRQLAGYTVPSWYGAAGWGTLDLLMNNHDTSSFAEAWYLNNQWILERTAREYPRLMEVEFNAPSIDKAHQDRAFSAGIARSGYQPGKDTIGLVHDRDVLAFYGDPLWTARLDESHAPSPWHIEYRGNRLTVTANRDAEGNVSYWFPKRRPPENTDAATLATPSAPGGKTLSGTGLLTNDFMLIRGLKLKKGEQAVVTFEENAPNLTSDEGEKSR